MTQTVEHSVVTDEQRSQLERDGYFIVRGLVSTEAINQIREAILEFVTGKRELKVTELVQELDAMPMDELAAKIRKLSGIGRQTEVIWNNYYAGPAVLAIVRQFLGETIYVKYDSVFLKPAKVGGATPWHQDIGLWRDMNTDAWNAWLAVDPATRENGCLQFVPGSHKGGVVPHIEYPSSPHGELPRKLVERTIAERGVAHIELQPGDCVMWHSHLWHYSPANRSDKRRIGMGAVWINPQQRKQIRMRNYHVAMVDGVVQPFPPKHIELDAELPLAVNEHIPLSDIV